jgi:uncharacterized oxidoreductase
VQVLDFSGTAPPGPAQIAQEIDINLTGLIQCAAAFLPALQRQDVARLVLIGSALAYVPLVQAPVYSATKAAVHAFAIALRQQLAGTQVRVTEVIPPVVQTGLHRGQDRQPPGAMPLDRFIAATLKGLDAGRPEVRVGLARVLRIGARIAPGLFMRIVNKAR